MVGVLVVVGRFVDGVVSVGVVLLVAAVVPIVVVTVKPW